MRGTTHPLTRYIRPQNLSCYHNSILNSIFSIQVNIPVGKQFTAVAINAMEEYKVPPVHDLRRLSFNREGSSHLESHL